MSISSRLMWHRRRRPGDSNTERPPPVAVPHQRAADGFQRHAELQSNACYDGRVLRRRVGVVAGLVVCEKQLGHPAVGEPGDGRAVHHARPRCRRWSRRAGSAAVRGRRSWEHRIGLVNQMGFWYFGRYQSRPGFTVETPVPPAPGFRFEDLHGSCSPASESAAYSASSPRCRLDYS
jgi:hypothetical protein